MSRTTIARAAVAQAIRQGRMSRPSSCESCGATENVCHHHWSYADEHLLDTIPLCRSCHGKVHAGSLVEPRTGRTYEPSGRCTVDVGTTKTLRDGKPQAAMAEKFGVSRARWAQWERDGSALPPGHAIRMVKMFGDNLTYNGGVAILGESFQQAYDQAEDHAAAHCESYIRKPLSASAKRRAIELAVSP